MMQILFWFTKGERGALSLINKMQVSHQSAGTYHFPFGTNEYWRAMMFKTHTLDVNQALINTITALDKGSWATQTLGLDEVTWLPKPGLLCLPRLWGENIVSMASICREVAL